MAVIIQGGITIGPGIDIGGTGGGGSGNGEITYAQMPPPVTAGMQLQDFTATVNDPIGFTINNSQNTGVAVSGLTQDNINYFNNNGTGTFLCTLGAGSTVNNIYVNIVTIPSNGGFGQLVWFFDPLETYPATFNYPFTIS